MKVKSFTYRFEEIFLKKLMFAAVRQSILSIQFMYSPAHRILIDCLNRGVIRTPDEKITNSD